MPAVVDWDILLSQLTAQLERAGADEVAKLDVGQVLILTRLDSMARQDGEHTTSIAELFTELRGMRERLVAIESRLDGADKKSGTLGAGTGGVAGTLAAILTKLIGG